MHNELNKGLEVGIFPCTWNWPNLFMKTAIVQEKAIIDLSAYCQTNQKYLKDVFTSRCLNILEE